jgi:uncharacterized protein YxeA
MRAWVSRFPLALFRYHDTVIDAFNSVVHQEKEYTKMAGSYQTDLFPVTEQQSAIHSVSARSSMRRVTGGFRKYQIVTSMYTCT